MNGSRNIWFLAQKTAATLPRWCQSNLKRWVGKCIVVSAAVMMLGLIPAGCVETAECDEDVRCPDGQICYELVCRVRCASTDDCSENQACFPCEEDDGTSIIDHCFQRRGNACLPTR